PEVVAPLGDAVRLVDGEQRDANPAKLLQKALVVEALRRDVQQLQRPGAQLAVYLAELLLGERAVQARGGDAALAQHIDLVLHQRDQRRDNHGDALEEQRGELVAQRFAAAGGKDRQRRALAEQRVDHLALAGAEGGQAEARSEQRFG